MLLNLNFMDAVFGSGRQAGRRYAQAVDPMEQPTAEESVENQHFRVMNRAFVRSAVELNSSRQGTVEVGEEIEALESAVFNGTVRVRFSRGWVSQNGPEGSTILEPIATAKSRRAEARERLLSGKRGATAAAAAGNDDSCGGGSGSDGADGEESPPMMPPPPVPTGGDVLDSSQQVVYRVLERALVRGEFKLDSQRKV